MNATTIDATTDTEVATIEETPLLGIVPTIAEGLSVLATGRNATGDTTEGTDDEILTQWHSLSPRYQEHVKTLLRGCKIAQAKEHEEEQSRNYLDSIIGRIQLTIRQEVEELDSLDGDAADDTLGMLLPLFDKETPRLTDAFEHPNRPDDRIDAALETFASLVFGSTIEGDHDAAFTMGAIYERVAFHPELSMVFRCTALAIWRLAQEEQHRAIWEKGWKSNRVPGFEG